MHLYLPRLRSFKRANAQSLSKLKCIVTAGSRSSLLPWDIILGFAFMKNSNPLILKYGEEGGMNLSQNQRVAVDAD